MQISIIIPIYKVEKYIKRCINSVITQTFTDYEVILVDDASPDNALQIAEKLLQENNIEFQTIKHLKNQGLAAARNSGITVSKGAYLMFMDSDDDLASTKVLQWFYNATKQGDFDLITARTNKYIAGIIESNHQNYYSEITILNNTEIIEAWMNDYIKNEAWNKLVSKKFIEDNHCFFIEGYQWEDLSWTFDLCSKATKACMLPQYTYNYYTATNTNAITYKMAFEHIDASRFHLTRVLEKINADTNLQNTLSVASIRRLIMGNINFILCNESMINNKQLWLKAYKILGAVYHNSFLYKSSKKLFFPPQLAYRIIYDFLPMLHQKKSIKKFILEYLFSINFIGYKNSNQRIK